MKNILIVTQYFSPENFIINQLAINLAEKECNVHVYSGYPSYPDRSNFVNKEINELSNIYKNITIHRYPIYHRRSGRINLVIHYLSYLLMGIIFSYKIISLNIKWHSILVFQISPITVILTGAWLKIFTKAKLITWVQDLWPDAVFSHFYSNKKKYPFNKKIREIINWFCIKIYSLSDLSLAQSLSYKDNLETNLKNKRVELVYNTIDDQNVEITANRKLYSEFNNLNIISAGNFSTTIPYDLFVNAIIKLKELYGKDIQWNFYGSGTQFEYFKKKVYSNDIDDVVNLLGIVSQSQLPKIMFKNDLFILGLIDEPLISKTCPSRLIYAMANSMPVIACANGEIARIVSESNCGFLSNPNDHDKLVSNIIKYKNMSANEKYNISNNSLNFYRKNFQKDMLFEKIYNLL